MHSYKYIIIGGGAAGISAAETIRQNDKDGSMAVVSDEPYPMYSRVMLSKPNFFLGKIPFDQIYLKNKKWYADNKIDFLGSKRAIALNPEHKELDLDDGSHLHYEKLLIATGVKARKWNTEGSSKTGVHYLRSLEDGIGIMKAIKTAKKAVTIGGGFISFEMADLLKMAGLDTTMILRESYFWEPVLDEASGLMIENAMTNGGVKIIKNAEVTEVLGNELVEGVRLSGASKTDLQERSVFDTLPCDLIICGIGVTNGIQWLENSGVKTNRGISTNEFMETSVPDVWTAGDIAEYKDLLLEENIQMGNWVNATEQGRVAGSNMAASNKTPFKFVSFYTTSGFGISIAFVGDVSLGTDRTIVTRGSPEINSYARIILRNGEIEGATMINRSSEMNAISKMIEKNMKVADILEQLGDTNTDLKSLIR
ncbi:FAD-dependent oxidoreductase [Patescibacteria group bacterium]|nr:FAD-dependent oxidoreductase [Patescibacteria group bacterium]MDE1946372.1 NAD(P)/FAD-dependent oxidoreductase [Patescibacteria group bacterium]MDE2010824.1 NAD(P)/FAD-dependent oxidoreductase [Patescibacteria group bacterium]MDE2233116.1 NAD(P)/FAD-dependent oxidoreductase [Patescibacteria group bacterium]